MADTDMIDPQADGLAVVPPVRDDEGNLSSAYVAAVDEAVDRDDVERLRLLTLDLHEADLADLIEALHHGDRAKLVRLLGSDFDYTALTELDDGLRVRILDDLPPEAVAEGVRDLDSDDAASILEDLDEPDIDAVLEQMPFVERVQLQRVLDYPEDSAGRLMQTDFIAVPPFWTIGQTIDYLRDEEDLPDEFYQILVVDPTFRLKGTVALDRLLRTKRPKKIFDIMDETLHSVEATDDQEEVARLFEHYNLVSVAVLDDAERLVGAITVDDVVDVIQEEVDEDIKLLAGVGDEEVSDTVLDTVRGRFAWLLVNLGTAVLASAVIALFDATIEQMVALAVLMPIVASMGGNAGTQTMTVAVRALATHDIDSFNATRIVSREAIVGLLNGVLFAVIIGIVAALWFSNLQLGGVIAAAMVVNMIAAGLCGILIPLGLNRHRIDPAIASGVFVTTVTDVVGFFAFLSFAAYWFGLG